MNRSAASTSREHNLTKMTNFDTDRENNKPFVRNNIIVQLFQFATLCFSYRFLVPCNNNLRSFLYEITNFDDEKIWRCSKTRRNLRKYISKNIEKFRVSNQINSSSCVTNNSCSGIQFQKFSNWIEFSTLFCTQCSAKNCRIYPQSKIFLFWLKKLGVPKILYHFFFYCLGTDVIHRQGYGDTRQRRKSHTRQVLRQKYIPNFERAKSIWKEFVQQDTSFQYWNNNARWTDLRLSE